MVTVCFDGQRVFSVIQSHLSFFPVLLEFCTRGHYSCGLTDFMSLIHLELFCIWCEKRIHFHSPACGHPGFPIPQINENILFPLCILGVVVENQLMEMLGFIPGFSVLFCWTMCPTLCQGHLVLITSAL